MVVTFASCAKKDKIAIENTEPVVDLESEQEHISEPDRFVSAIVLSPSTKLYLQGRDNKEFTHSRIQAFSSPASAASGRGSSARV